MQRSGTLFPWHHTLKQLEQLHHRLPPLQDTFASWQHAGRSSRSEALAHREYVLGVATLSGASLRLLYDLASPHVKDLPERIYWHAPTHSAGETQAVLPPEVLVQKTVSVEMAGRLLLWTSVGEQAHTLEQRRSVAESLGLPRRAAKQCSTNSATCRPEEEFGMLPGMVSPFLPPFHPSRLAAVVQLAWPADWEDQAKAAQSYVRCHGPQSKQVSKGDKVPNCQLEAEHEHFFGFTRSKTVTFWPLLPGKFLLHVKEELTKRYFEQNILLLCGP